MYLIWLLFVYIVCVFETDMVDKNSRIKWKIICSSNNAPFLRCCFVIVHFISIWQNWLQFILFTIRYILIGHSVSNPFQVEYVQYDLHCKIGWPWNQQQFSVHFQVGTVSKGAACYLRKFDHVEPIGFQMDGISSRQNQHVKSIVWRPWFSHGDKTCHFYIHTFIIIKKWYDQQV